MRETPREEEGDEEQEVDDDYEQEGTLASSSNRAELERERESTGRTSHPTTERDFDASLLP